MSGGTWKGHDRERDLPMLGIDPNAEWDWVAVDSGERPDNRGPEHFTQLEGVEGNGGHIVGARPDIGSVERGLGSPREPSDGTALMAYHRELATAQQMSTKSDELALRTVGL
jgi:hypothetical protein